MLRKALRIFLIVYLILLPISAVVAYFFRENKIAHDGEEHVVPLIVFILACAGILLLYMALFFVIFLVLWSLYDLMKSEFKLTHNKILWFVLILLLPVVGTVFYLLISPEQKVQPMDKKVSF